ncbi:MAG: trehalose-phosphatase [Ilumatobacteraceae bacterium]
MTAAEAYRDETEFDDPTAVGAFAASLAAPLLVGLDVDGVLAPIVAHADDALLLPGMLAAVRALAALTPVAVVSGRTVDDLGRFGFPDDVAMFGLHGMERRAERTIVLADHEQARLEQLRAMAADAADRAGDGAWVEVKPASVVLHVREAHPSQGADSADELRRQAADVTGAHVLSGHDVVELLTRATSKAVAIAELRAELSVASVVFVGDDRTDEEVFADLGPGDCAIRVGRGATAARHRLAGPPEVLAFLDALAARL